MVDAASFGLVKLFFNKSTRFTVLPIRPSD
jgi:hypothetical protein